jgi:hypothetical protein
MELISIREFARRNGVSHVAILAAVRAGRLPDADGKIDADVAQPVWDHIKGPRARGHREVTTSLRVTTPSKNACQVTTIDAVSKQVTTAVTTPLDPIQARPEVTTQYEPGSQVTTPIARRPERRYPITIAINGAEFLEVAKWAQEMKVTIPACVRTKCGLPPWIYRGGEMVGRASQMQGGVMALDRLAVTIMVTETERGRLQAEARIVGLSLAQFVRVACGWLVRQTSLPNTEGRYREEDDAWERLQRLGLEPKNFFPQDKSQPEPTQ